LLLVIVFLLGFDLFLELISMPIDEGISLEQAFTNFRIHTVNGAPITGEFESLIMRVNKFLSVYDYMRSNYEVMFFGCGYGCGNGAIDSGLVRLLLEFGFIGFLMAIFLVKKIPTAPLAVIISVNFLFDGLWSSVVSPVILSYFFSNLTFIKELYVHSKR